MKTIVFIILSVLVLPVFSLTGEGTLPSSIIDTVLAEITVTYPNSGEEIYIAEAADIIRSSKDYRLTRLNSPENLTITTDGNDVYLSWDVTQYAISYNIYRSNFPDSVYCLIDTSYTTSYTDLNACLQEKYFYYVTAVDNPTLTVTDIDGNVYQTVQIGDQLWMAENLKVTHYRNGDQIPNITYNLGWYGISYGAYGVYNNTPANADTYGNLYNGYAVDDSRNIAPEGWHVPTDEEIMELEMYLGMNSNQAYGLYWRGTNEGSKLAGRADLWSDGALENDPEFDTSGLSFLPGGYRYSINGYFYYMSDTGYFWSSTDFNTGYAWYRYLNYDNATVYRYYWHKLFGLSVRCVKD